MRTPDGMAGRLKGKAPKLSVTQRTVLLKLHGVGEPMKIASIVSQIIYATVTA